MNFEQLSVFTLGHGDHENPEQGLCAMEAVAWLEGLPHSDKPECTCPVIGAFVRSFNDHLPDDKRQMLVPYLPKLVGTVSPEHEQERGEYLAWQAIRVFAPAALDAVGLHEHADTLRKQTDLNAAYAAARAADAAADAAAYAAADAAAYAADAAAYAAAYAADAAARAAARAARAADAAADAADAAADAADIWELGFNCLDGLLLIGKQAQPFSRDTDEAVAAYRDLIADHRLTAPQQACA